MDFRYRGEVTTFAAGVRAFLTENLTAEIRRRMHETGTIHDRDLHRAMAERGWLGTAAGSFERDPFELPALFRELELADAPYHGLSITMIVVGVIERLGSPELKARVMPRLSSGEAIAVLGYSEPDSGSDVAAARTRAAPADDSHSSWVINGQKMWTTLAHEAGYVLLLTRTDTESRKASKRRGLTMFLVPLDASGITISAVHTIAGERTNAVFFDDVHVSDDCRIGEVNGGWDVMAVALSMERGVMGGTAMIEPLVERAIEWATTASADGPQPIDDPAVAEAIARARIDAEVACLLSQRTAWLGANGQHPALAGSMGKLFATTAYQRASARLQELAGASGVLSDGEGDDEGDSNGASSRAAAAGAFERAVRHAAVTTIQGGTTEIAKNHIAEHYLGLPKARLTER